MKLTVEQLKKMVKEAIVKEQAAQGAGVSTPVAPPVTKEQAASRGGKKTLWKISTQGSYIPMGFGVGATQQEAAEDFLVNELGQSPEAAAGNSAHFSAENIGTPVALNKEREKLNKKLEEVEALIDSLNSAMARGRGKR